MILCVCGWSFGQPFCPLFDLLAKRWIVAAGDRNGVMRFRCWRRWGYRQLPSHNATFHDNCNVHSLGANHSRYNPDLQTRSAAMSKKRSNPPAELTSMVNYWPSQPKWMIEGTEPRSRLISGRKRPIFKLEQVLSRFQSTDDIIPSTRECKDNLTDLLWTTKDILETLKALKQCDYINSQWCKISSKSWVPCDAYSASVKFGESENTFIKIYIKYTVSPTGKVILVVSCHESEI